MMQHEFRSIFISDVHLGTKDVHFEFLLDMLNSTKAEFIYLVGDIIDLWSMKKGWYWPNINNEIVNSLLDKVKKGSKVMYIPGNHDERLRDYVGSNFNDVLICQDAVHTTQGNKKLLVIHGDEFDSVVMTNKWLVHFGNWIYDYIVILNRYYNYLRRKLGFPYWSLSNFLKTHTNKAMQYIANFEHFVVQEAKRRNMDGVVCGHIHHPAMKEIDGVVYANTGDWIENCTVLVEHKDGKLEVLRWSDVSENRLVNVSKLRPAA